MFKKNFLIIPEFAIENGIRRQIRARLRQKKALTTEDEMSKEVPKPNWARTYSKVYSRFFLSNPRPSLSSRRFVSIAKFGIILIIFLGFFLDFTSIVFAQSPAVNYLCKKGLKYYNQGAAEDALAKFNKVLLIDPQNKVALKYVQKLKETNLDFSREVKINNTLEEIKLRQQLIVEKPEQSVQNQYSLPAQIVSEPLIKMSGDAQIALGVDSEGEAIWKRVNFDLNEKNWRILSNSVYNKQENTYDPAIYDRLSVKLDTPKDKDGFGFHTNITVDPWSFIGKTDKVTLTGAGGDTAEIQLKYWSNTGYTLNSAARTLKNGDSFNLPEIKVKDGKTVPTTVFTTWSNIFTIPEMRIHREFQPFREFWVDYQQEDYLKLHVFPIAGESQAYTSDDPLKLSNNHIYWEDSPWLRAWKKGNFNSGAATISFTKGYWDNSSSFAVRDSSGNRLTALRGFSFDFNPSDKTAFTTNWATPKDLWQEYSEIDNIGGASRVKQSVGDNFILGLTHTARFGLVSNGEKIDGRNQVLGTDAAYEVKEGTKVVGEAAVSESTNDLTNSTYKTKSRGNAYLFSVVNRYPQKEIINSAYEQIQTDKNESFMSKFKFLFAHMDKGFDPALSSYRQTRRDAFWSRHLHFHQAFNYFYQGLSAPSLKLDDLKVFAIGDGLDIGRDVLGFRWETTWPEQFNNLFDARNVHDVNGGYIETVARDEATWKVNDKLTAKTLGVYQDLPKTRAGIDSFLYDSRTGIYLTDWSGVPIKEGKDPSIKTGSFGLDYAVTDWLSVNGIYEHTNDYTLAYDNFPRGNLNSSQPSDSYSEYGNIYLRDRNFLYDQQLFPQPPYSFYSVYKAGVTILPIENLQLYLDYTRNEFKKAGQISDSMNHFGSEIEYLPTSKLGLYLRYTYSLWKDLDRLRAGDSKTVGHHNIFGSVRYSVTKSQEFDLEYGISPNYPITETIAYDPYGGGLQTIDTQHIIRFFYRRKF